jgi:predicted esterase
LANEEFLDIQSRLFEFYNQKKYEDALAVAEEAVSRFPERRDRTSFWVACLQTRLGENDKAVESLRQGLRGGVWWSEHWLLGDADLLPLHDREDFKELLAECASRGHQAQLGARPGLNVYTPLGYSDDRTCPLMIALHGRDTNDVDFSQDWKSAKTNGVVLAVPRSSQLGSIGSFHWDDLDKAEQEIARAYSSVKKTYKIDARKVILAGYSQGAALAIYLTLKKRVPSVGFIGVAPSLSISPGTSEEWPNLMRSGTGSGLRGWLFVGDQDPRFQEQKAMHAEMVHRGLQCQIAVAEGVGHAYPRDFGSKLTSAIQFVLS